MVRLPAVSVQGRRHPASRKPARRSDTEPGQGRRRSALHARGRAAHAPRRVPDRRVPGRRAVGRAAVLGRRQRHRRQSDGALGARLGSCDSAGGSPQSATFRYRARTGTRRLRRPDRPAGQAEPQHPSRVPWLRLRDSRRPGHLPSRALAEADVRPARLPDACRRLCRRGSDAEAVRSDAGGAGRAPQGHVHQRPGHARAEPGCVAQRTSSEPGRLRQVRGSVSPCSCRALFPGRVS